MSQSTDLRAPFPYFGGKSRAAALVWSRFGKVVNYVEPFFGSGAVLLACPEENRPKVETVNDVNALLCNFWRAVRGDSEAVAQAADYPVIETDLHARHRWLLTQAAGLRERLDSDPDWFDAKIAGWWVWGASAWIGSGWCEEARGAREQAPRMGGASSDGKATAWYGAGIHAAGMREPAKTARYPRKMPAFGEYLYDEEAISYARSWGLSLETRGSGAWETVALEDAINAVSGATAVALPVVRVLAGDVVESSGPRRQLIHLGGGDGSGNARAGAGINGAKVRARLYDIFSRLSTRLRYTRVACGDFARILTPAVTYRHGLTAVFLDPPYDGFEHLYGAAEEHAEPLSARVRAWALEMGVRPDMRIALCGYEGEHDMPGWECVAWKAKGGYGNQREGGTNENARRERIWFSPACLRTGVDTGQIDMFARANGAPVRG